MACDRAGNCSEPNSTYIRLDKTKPVIGEFVINGEAGLNGWYVSDVEVTVTDSYDDLSQIDTVTLTPDDTTITEDTEGITYTLTATDKAGNSVTYDHIVKVDKTDPTAGTATFSGTIGNNDWYTSDVIATLTNGSDITSGHLSTTIDFETINFDTKGQVVTVKTVDNAGNESTREYTIKRDASGPLLGQLEFTGSLGLNDWYVSDVEVSYDEIIDDISGIASEVLTPNNKLTVDTDGITYTLTATDNAGNTSSISQTIKRDTEKPSLGVVTINGTKGTNDWYTSDVTISLADGTDTLSGFFMNVIDIDQITENTNGTTVTYTAFDNAGNENSKEYVIKIDKDKPVLTAKTGPFEITEGDSVDSKTYFNTPTYSISGEQSYTCSPANTSSLSSGTQTISCTAKGRNGLSTTTTKSITINKKSYSVTLNVANGTGGSTKTVTVGGKATWTITPNSGYTTTGATFSPSGCGTISGSTVTISNVTGPHTCTVTLPIKDTTPPTIASIKAKGYIGGNTITGTLKDNSNLAGYYITSNSSYACGKTSPTSWNSISGTSKSLNAKVTNYGTTYIWVKDAAGNTNCTSKTLYLVNPIVSGTNTCQLLSDSYVKEDSNTIKMQINVKCSCGITGTCRNGRNGGTDSDRGYAGVEVKGATSVYYKIWGYSYSTDSLYTGPSWGGKIYQYQTLSTTLPNSELTINSSNNQLLTTNGEGDGVSGYTDWSSSNYMTLSKITANGVSIYNNGFVEY